MNILINIDVPDLAEGIEFYTAAVGLTLARVLDNDVAELLGEGYTIYLLQKESQSTYSATSSGDRIYSRHWTPIHIDFVVDDIVRASERAVAAGAKCESECVEWRGSKCLTFSDPFGHGFCLIEFTRDSYLEETES